MRFSAIPEVTKLTAVTLFIHIPSSVTASRNENKDKKDYKFFHIDKLFKGQFSKKIRAMEIGLFNGNRIP